MNCFQCPDAEVKTGLLPVMKQSVNDLRDPTEDHMNQCHFLEQSTQEEYLTAYFEFGSL